MWMTYDVYEDTHGFRYEIPTFPLAWNALFFSLRCLSAAYFSNASPSSLKSLFLKKTFPDLPDWVKYVFLSLIGLF